MSEVKFEREDRYAVFKFSDMDEAQMRILRDTICRLPRRECVVVESDWPEYGPVWQMIQQRMTGEGMEVAETMGYSVFGNRYMIALTQQEILEHSQSYAGCMFELVARSALDAQRLRVDTAEAERDGAKAANAVLREELRTERLRADAAAGDANEAERKLAAAEQRIAVLAKALKDIRENSEDIGACECAADALKDAALNPNPEAESHETN